MKRLRPVAGIVAVAGRESGHGHRGSSWAEGLGWRVHKRGIHPGADIRSSEARSPAGHKEQEAEGGCTAGTAGEDHGVRVSETVLMY